MGGCPIDQYQNAPRVGKSLTSRWAGYAHDTEFHSCLLTLCLKCFVVTVRIMNQILDIASLLANFHPNSLDFIRQLQRWIGGIDWWRWLVKCQLARNMDQWLIPSMWQLKSEAPSLFKDGFSTRSQMASRTPCSKHCSSWSRIITFLTLDQSSPSVNTTNSSLQLPDEVQWVRMKICKQANYIQYLIHNSNRVFFDWMIDNIHQYLFCS